MLTDSCRCSWSFLRPVCSALRRSPGFSCPTREKHLRPCVVKVSSGSGGVLGRPSSLIEIGNRSRNPRSCPTWAERVLAAAMALEPRGVAYRGLGRKRHCRKRKKSTWTTEEIAPLPRRTSVKVQGGTSSRCADLEKTQCKSIGDAMEPKAGVDLQFAYSVVSEFLGGTRRSGCT